MKFRDLTLSHIEEIKEILETSQKGMEKHSIAPEVVYQNLGKLFKKIELVESIIKRENQSV